MGHFGGGKVNALLCDGTSVQGCFNFPAQKRLEALFLKIQTHHFSHLQGLTRVAKFV